MRLMKERKRLSQYFVDQGMRPSIAAVQVTHYSEKRVKQLIGHLDTLERAASQKVDAVMNKIKEAK